MPEPPTVFTVCGLPASGKSTLARRIARERGGVCFSADEWMLTLYGADLDATATDELRERVWSLIWGLAARLLELGLDVVLDFSFYTRAERDRFARLAHQAGARFRMFHLEAPRALLLERVAARNAAPPPGTFALSPAQFEALEARFERPSAEEGPQILRVHADEELEPFD